MMLPNDINRSTMPNNGLAENVYLADAVSKNPVFNAIANEVKHEREVQAVKWDYTYEVTGTVAGQQTLPFNITIEQGTDFKCLYLTGSCFSYDAVNDSDFPIPNSAGVTSWAGRGISIKMTDTRSGRELTSGFIPAEIILSPGYGMNFQNPYPFRYFFYRNSKIRFDIRNRDNSNRTHEFNINLNGFKILTPQ